MSWLTCIHVTFAWEGVHRWPDADPEGPFAFLANPHRHVFQGDAWIQVYHDDRELEFLAVKLEINRLLPNYQDMGSTSCEQMAKMVAECLLNKYGWNREVTVEVSEDGENGALVEWTPPGHDHDSDRPYVKLERYEVQGPKMNPVGANCFKIWDREAEVYINYPDQAHTWEFLKREDAEAAVRRHHATGVWSR